MWPGRQHGLREQGADLDSAGAQNMNAGLLDPATMIADGMDFEFAKASQGTWFTDDYFAENRARAAAGRPVVRRLPLPGEGRRRRAGRRLLPAPTGHGWRERV